MRAPLRILFASPAYWPAHAFGGPVAVARELVARLTRDGHEVDVVTTTLVDVGQRPARRTRVAQVDGATVTYLATPVRYRWMGITPTLPAHLVRRGKPDVAHVMGFRDPVTTGVAAWCRARGVPYVFEPVGMFRPRLRKVALKRAFDATVARGVAGGAKLVVVSSDARARRRRRLRRPTRAHPRARQRASPSRRIRPASIRSRASSRRARRSSSTSAGSPPRRGSSTSSRPRAACPRPTSCSRAPTTATGRWTASGPPSSTRRPTGASTSSRRRPGRRTTSTAARTSSCSPRAARTSGSSPPRLPRSGRPWSSPTGPGSRRPSRRARRSSSRTTRTRRSPRSSGSSTDAALRAQLSEGALRAAARSTWDAVAAQQEEIYREAIDAG